MLFAEADELLIFVLFETSSLSGHPMLEDCRLRLSGVGWRVSIR